MAGRGPARGQCPSHIARSKNSDLHTSTLRRTGPPSRPAEVPYAVPHRSYNFRRCTGASRPARPGLPLGDPGRETAPAKVRRAATLRSTLGLLAAPAFCRVLAMAALLGLVSVGDGFLYLVMQKRLD